MIHSPEAVNKMKRFVSPLLGIGLFVIVNGCAAAVPNEKIAATDSSIRAAEELGAPRVPQASLHLQLAKEENGNAQKLMKDGDTKHAEGQLMRAQADAELALALAREAPMQAEAQQEVDKAHSLQQQSTH
jgi:flavin reductase (DIM6/NTAB) family NADH-FMN oxidoreductase RutF